MEQLSFPIVQLRVQTQEDFTSCNIILTLFVSRVLQLLKHVNIFCCLFLLETDTWASRDTRILGNTIYFENQQKQREDNACWF